MIRFDPHAVWVGAYWHWRFPFEYRVLDVNICVIPMFPMQFTWRRW